MNAKLFAVFFGLSFALLAVADEQRADHFSGKAAANLQQAVANFSVYNQHLAEILKRDELKPEDMVKIHEMSYTLENALRKINEEMSALEATLERVHLGSESMDFETVKTEGKRYLSVANQVVRKL